MAKPELGLKRLCVSCNTRFYDLMRTPAVCPKCGTEQPLELPKLRRMTPLVEERKLKKPEVEEAEVETEAEASEDEAEEGVLEDTSDLEDDADAIGGDIEVEPEGDEAER